jgi:cobalamin biosynthesis protein CbiG
MIVAGIGCRKGTASAVIADAVTAALASCGLARTRLDALATHVTKCDEPGLRALAEEWQLRLLAFTTDDMDRHAAGVETVSQRVVALKGVPSVAEAAALTGAGRGARLIAARVANGEATCAIAEGVGNAVAEARPEAKP